MPSSSSVRANRMTLALLGKTDVLTYLLKRVFHELGEVDYPDIKREYYNVDTTCIEWRHGLKKASSQSWIKISSRLPPYTWGSRPPRRAIRWPSSQ